MKYVLKKVKLDEHLKQTDVTVFSKKLLIFVFVQP